MRSFRTPTVILALSMLLFGFGLGHSLALPLGARATAVWVAHVGPAGAPGPVYLPTVFRSGLPPVWPPTAGASWLEWVNYYRALALLPPVSENAAFTTGAQNHAHYMLVNNVVEPFELSVARQGYTAAGAAAAVNSLLLGSGSAATTDAQALAFWMQGPFHALGILDPALQQTGFGSERDPGGALLQMTAALNVISGLDPTRVPAGLYPVQWPSDGMTVYLNSYTQGTDAPEPLTSCPGFLSPTGLPISLQLGNGNLTTVNVSASALWDGTNFLDHCIFTENTYLNPDSILQTRGRALLGMRDAIVLIPRYPLTAGAVYTVSLTANQQSYRWAFTVGQ
jgi:Cysteine-rich secretory protein family